VRAKRLTEAKAIVAWLLSSAPFVPSAPSNSIQAEELDSFVRVVVVDVVAETFAVVEED
jgi:hypothetical protein